MPNVEPRPSLVLTLYFGGQGGEVLCSPQVMSGQVTSHRDDHVNRGTKPSNVRIVSGADEIAKRHNADPPDHNLLC